MLEWGWCSGGCEFKVRIARVFTRCRLVGTGVDAEAGSLDATECGSGWNRALLYSARECAYCHCGDGNCGRAESAHVTSLAVAGPFEWC
jgi:hypothetical protein